MAPLIFREKLFKQTGPLLFKARAVYTKFGTPSPQAPPKRGVLNGYELVANDADCVLTR
jgi:hypothetical protein